MKLVDQTECGRVRVSLPGSRTTDRRLLAMRRDNASSRSARRTPRTAVPRPASAICSVTLDVARAAGYLSKTDTTSTWKCAEQSTSVSAVNMNPRAGAARRRGRGSPSQLTRPRAGHALGHRHDSCGQPFRLGSPLTKSAELATIRHVTGEHVRVSARRFTRASLTASSTIRSRSLTSLEPRAHPRTRRLAVDRARWSRHLPIRRVSYDAASASTPFGRLWKKRLREIAT